MAQIQSGLDATQWTIDSTSKAGRVTFYDTDGNKLHLAKNEQPSVVNGLISMSMNDERAVPVRADRSGGIALAYHNPLYSETFEGVTVNPIRWTVIATTMAAVQATATGLTINNAGNTSANVGYILKSNRSFYKSQRQPLQAKIRCSPQYQINSVMEFGFGDASTYNGANTAGAYWQCTASGAVIPVLTFNSIDQTGSDIAGLIDKTKFYTFDVIIDDDEVIYFCQDTSTGLIVSQQTIKLPLSGPRLWSATQVSAIARLYNTGTAPPSAAKLIISDFYVAGLDAAVNLDTPTIQALSYRNATSNPFTGAQTAAWTNSTEPASATLSNTAAGYTTLGGKFQFAAVAGAITDYALFGFQVPAPATLCITDIEIETWNTGAANAATPTLLTWGIAYNLTAVSLATGNHERIGLGSQMIPGAAAIGQNADRPINKSFKAPLVCGPGRYINIILRIPVGAATASQVIAGMVNIKGYWM